MSRYVYVNRSNAGTGCGCLALTLLLLLIFLRALWRLLPLVLLALLGLMVWHRYIRPRVNPDQKDPGHRDYRAKDDDIIQPENARHIKEAEVIEEEE